MKRYKVLQLDFDTRADILKREIKDELSKKLEKNNYQNIKIIKDELIAQYGPFNAESKLQNFIDIGPKYFSILAFHNKFFEQIRNSFVVGAYYPALTGACALGERILNHLVIKLRDDYKDTCNYKDVYRKESFDNWKLLIDTLENWDVLLPEVVTKFKELEKMRHKAIHFRPDVDENDRELSLNAIHCLHDIIQSQFSGFGNQPWFIQQNLSESYIKKSLEKHPFIKRIYLPNCWLVGPKHTVKAMFPKVIVDDNHEYLDEEISDDEFSRLRKDK